MASPINRAPAGPRRTSNWMTDRWNWTIGGNFSTSLARGCRGKYARSMRSLRGGCSGWRRRNEAETVAL